MRRNPANSGLMMMNSGRLLTVYGNFRLSVGRKAAGADRFENRAIRRAVRSGTTCVANAAARNHGRKRSGLEPAEPRQGPASNHPWASASRSLRQFWAAASTDWTDQAAPRNRSNRRSDWKVISSDRLELSAGDPEAARSYPLQADGPECRAGARDDLLQAWGGRASAFRHSSPDLFRHQPSEDSPARQRPRPDPLATF